MASGSRAAAVAEIRDVLATKVGEIVPRATVVAIVSRHCRKRDPRTVSELVTIARRSLAHEPREILVFTLHGIGWRVVRASPAMPHEQYGLVFEPYKRRITSPHGTVSLTPREAQVVLALFEADEPMTARDIAIAIGSGDTDQARKSMGGLLTALRKKLPEPDRWVDRRRHNAFRYQRPGLRG